MIRRPQPPNAKKPAPGRILLLAALFPPLLAFLCYLPLLWNGFVNYDDPPFITENRYLSLPFFPFTQWAFTTFYRGNWMPLSWLSLWVDHALGGTSPWVYHLHSLLLHVLNTLLVYFLAQRLFSRFPQPRLAAMLASVLFALHPLHVESVAWANEQRDLLCAFFYLLSLYFYLETPGKPGWTRWPLPASLICFALSAMCKPMAVSLPLVLLILDHWPLQRAAPSAAVRFLEKIPFFLLSLAMAAVALLAQTKADAIPDMRHLPPLYRLANAIHSLAFYLWKMALPTGLHPYYPFEASRTLFSPTVILSLLLVAAISWASIHWRRERPWLAAAWFFYLITLFPVLGLVQTGSQAAADRFTYLPSLGPFLIASGATASLLKDQKAYWALVSLTACLLGALTIHQLGIWGNSIVFWEDVVKAYPNSYYLPHYDLGQAYFEAGRMEDALREADKALALDPAYAGCHSGRGVALAALGRTGEALAEFEQAASLDPADPKNHLTLAAAYLEMGSLEKSQAELKPAEQASPGLAQDPSGLGRSYSRIRQALSRRLPPLPADKGGR